MKIIFKIPAYPAFYKTDIEEFTQAEVDQAAQEHSEFYKGTTAEAKVKWEREYVQEGQPRFEFDDELKASISSYPTQQTQLFVEHQMRQIGHCELAVYMRQMRTNLETNAG